MTKWTPEQWEAIMADNSELLVSAAAGSGKTAVLIERIWQLIQKGARVDRMVIVTFTKAAAAQMKERLLQKLSAEAEKGDQNALKQIDLLPMSQIGTIHSFCNHVLKNHFHVVGVDPNAMSLDQARREKMLLEALDSAMTELAQNPTPGYDALNAAFEDKDIEAMALDLYRFIMSLKAPFDWLREKSGETFDEESLVTHPFIMVLLNQVRVLFKNLATELADYDAMMLSPYAHEKWSGVVQADIELIQGLIQAENVLEINRALETGYIRVPIISKASDEVKEWHEQMKTMRNRLKDIIKKATEDLPKDLARTAADLNAMRLPAIGLYDLIVLFHKLFQEIKRDVNVLDYDDLIHKTLEVLQNDDSRAQLQAQVDHLFVDEYQDVGDAEEGIFQGLRRQGQCFFMVGDVKQSIYRFRLCDPTLFMNKQASFSEDKNAKQRKIFLNKNFRSAPALLQSVNYVFETLMQPHITELAYDESQRLNPGREAASADTPELFIMPYEAFVTEDEDKPDKLFAEFQKAADVIADLMQKPLYDNKKKQSRTTRFSDIAILMPKAKDIAQKLQDFLKEQGIPAYADNDESYYELPEIKRMLALLHTLDNPREDVTFLTTLKLPLFDYSDEELADIRLFEQNRKKSFYDAFVKISTDESSIGIKCKQTLETLALWRFFAKHQPLDILIWDLMKESGLYLVSGAQKGGHVRQSNLRLLCEYAVNYQNAGMGGLHGFLRLSGQIGEQGDSKGAKELSPRDNLVRIMTIHKSKGLEFPIVILMGLGGQMLLSEKRKLRPHKDLGFAIPYVNPLLRITRKTLGQKAITALNEMQEKAERVRLLYVAMTRAEEKLIMLGTVSKLPREQFSLMGDYGLFTAKTYLDLLMLPTGCHERLVNSLSTGYPQHGEPYAISVCDIIEQQAVDKSDWLSTGLSALLAPVEQEVVDNVSKLFERTLPVSWPLKTSVSALLHQQPFASQEETVALKASGSFSAIPMTMADLPAAPAFMKPPALSASALGSAVHMALTKITRDRPIEVQLREMQQAGLLTEELHNAIPIQWLENFFNSDIYQRVLKSPLVKREWSFNIKLFENQDTLVQGVIDLAFLEEEQWVLCDYKTDRKCDEDTLLARYAPQVKLYRTSLERVQHRPVKEAFLFALRTGEIFRVI